MESELKFEKALERLEKIVEDLENGNMPLEDALKKYEEGVKLSRLCAQKLTQAETKIEVLTKALSGTVPEPERKRAKKRGEDSERSDDPLLI
ncbi:MAG: exodeoxyribonuclease VII small subunit [Candidatus Omnitrophica bacterium]|nr:exodeoxyribonuclease VII small subunit [Candidatus Omnitrophota bacterium]